MGTRTRASMDARPPKPHVASIETLEPRLLLAATYWIVEPVDQPGDVGTFASMALDGDGHPHIGYYDATNGNLKYAEYDGATWTTQTVDAPGNVGQFTSLKLGSDGYARISYYDATNATLKLATQTGAATWTIQTVDATPGVGQFNSLALATNDNPSISYYDAVDEDLMYASWDGAIWNIQNVDGNAGSISEFNDNNSQVGTWTGLTGVNPSNSDGYTLYVTIVDEGGGNFRVDLYRDAGRTQIVGHTASYSASGAQAILADNASGLGGAMNIDAVVGADNDIAVDFPAGTQGWVGTYTSLALDAGNKPRIAYYDVDSGYLNYAYNDGTNWWYDIVDLSADVGEFNSLALDPSGKPRVSYYDATNGNLMYASWDAGVWTTQAVDSAGDVGEFSSLFLDGAGKPHISYLDYTNGTVKYATPVGAVWQVQPVDALGWNPGGAPSGGLNVGLSTSLALDSSGLPVIAYYGYSTRDLKLARPNYAPSLTSVNVLYSATEDAPYTITYAALLAASNAQDFEGDPLSFRVESVTSGTLTEGGTPVVPGVTMLSAGEELVWTSVANVSGIQDAFTVVAWEEPYAGAPSTENLGTSTPSVQVRVNVLSVNDAPTLDTVTVLAGGGQNTPNTITYAALAAAANEADADGDPLSFRVESVDSGTLTQGGVAVTPGVTLLTSASLPLVWTPALNAFGVLNAFTVAAWDGSLASAGAPVQVQVQSPLPDLVPIITKGYRRVVTPAALTDTKIPKIKVEITNSGTLTAFGITDAIIHVSTTPAFGSGTTVYSRQINFGTKGLLAGASRKVTLGGGLAPALAAGSYYVFVQVNGLASINELTLGNNIIQGAQLIQWR